MIILGARQPPSRIFFGWLENILSSKLFFLMPVVYFHFTNNPKIRTELKNVYYDLAACPLLYDSSLYRNLIDVVGYKKILWGTDYPLRIYPKIQSTPDFSTFRKEILKVTQLNKDEEKAIFHQNILSLLPC
jgi:predicted TIM-barrel fold metal-dependent hydrolase